MTLSCCDEKPASNALKMCAFEGTAASGRVRQRLRRRPIAIIRIRFCSRRVRAPVILSQTRPGRERRKCWVHARFRKRLRECKSFLDVFIAVVVVVVVVLVVVVVVEINNNENNRKKIDDIALVARERPSRPREDTITSRARVTPSSPSLLSLSVEKNFFLLFFSRDALFFVVVVVVKVGRKGLRRERRFFFSIARERTL